MAIATVTLDTGRRVLLEELHVEVTYRDLGDGYPNESRNEDVFLEAETRALSFFGDLPVFVLWPEFRERPELGMLREPWIELPHLTCIGRFVLDPTQDLAELGGASDEDGRGVSMTYVWFVDSMSDVFGADALANIQILPWIGYGIDRNRGQQNDQSAS